MPCQNIDVTVIGAGLAGCEAAWQLATLGFRVRLFEMKRIVRTPAQVSQELCELVCSNSLRSSNPLNAVGMLKEEMARLDSLVISTAKAHAVPAGDALAVSREAFGQAMTDQIVRHPNIDFVSEVITRVPDASQGPVIVATGPLTGTELAQDLARLMGQTSLYFYDAIAPIVAGDSIDMSQAFFASRWGKGSGDDYINCPMDKPTYEAFYQALISAESMPLHAFEEARYFQGCQPVEVIAQSSVDGLRFGPLKPAGLTDPKTGRWPYAVVQLRKEDTAGQAYNLVGFQTKMKYPDQKRVLAMIPGLQNAQYIRMGAIHRNTYSDAPKVLDDALRLKAAPHVRLAGQITGVEGYVESAGIGLLVAHFVARELRGNALAPPPLTTALGALWGHLRGALRLPKRAHEPHNVNWSLVPPMEKVKKIDAKQARARRAVKAFNDWAESQQLGLAPISSRCEQAIEPAPPAPPKVKKEDALAGPTVVKTGDLAVAAATP